MAFAAYAVHRVRGAIFDELRRLDWVPRGVRDRIRHTERAIATLYQRLDRQPTDEEIARELGVDVEAYRSGLADGVTLVSLSATAAPDGEGAALVDYVRGHAGRGSPAGARRGRAPRGPGGAGRHAPQRERQVLALYYHEELTMREVGTVLGVTESRVSQLHSSAVHRLTVLLRRRRLGESDLRLPEPASSAARSAR